MLKVFFFLGASPASVRAAHFPSWNHFAWKKPGTSSEEEEAANGLSKCPFSPVHLWINHNWPKNYLFPKFLRDKQCCLRIVLRWKRIFLNPLIKLYSLSFFALFSERTNINSNLGRYFFSSSRLLGLWRTPSHMGGALDTSLQPGGGVWGCFGSKLWWGGTGIWTPDLLQVSQES